MTGRARIGCGRLLHRNLRMIVALVTALLLVAMASSRSQAQSDAGRALPDPAMRTPAAAGPIVVLPSQRVPRPSPPRAKGGGPIVFPQIATPAINPLPGTGRDQLVDL